jgi:hypothetical protein
MNKGGSAIRFASTSIQWREGGNLDPKVQLQPALRESRRAQCLRAPRARGAHEGLRVEEDEEKDVAAATRKARVED